MPLPVSTATPCAAVAPATVRQRLTENIRKLGVGNLLGLFQLGTLPAELTRTNMRLFAEDVMPQLREELKQTI